MKKRAVTGDLNKMRALTNLLTSNLYKKMTGEFSKMRALTNLQTRGLHQTQVTGDIVGLRGFMNLEMLWTYWLL